MYLFTPTPSIETGSFSPKALKKFSEGYAVLVAHRNYMRPYFSNFSHTMLHKPSSNLEQPLFTLQPATNITYQEPSKYICIGDVLYETKPLQKKHIRLQIHSGIRNLNTLAPSYSIITIIGLKNWVNCDFECNQKSEKTVSKFFRNQFLEKFSMIFVHTWTCLLSAMWRRYHAI